MRGSALITDAMTPGPNPWDDIDPTVLIDDDGSAWLAWGNPNLYLARLKPNMIEIDGPIQRIHVPNYTEGPWLHKRYKLYYLTYACFAHQGLSEKLCHANAPALTGPWTYRGILTGAAANSYTIHPGIVDFKGQSYLFYHNAAQTIDGQAGALGRRSVTAEYLFYRPDGSIAPITQTAEGLSVPPVPPAPQAQLAAPDKSDAGINVTQQSGAAPADWPGRPVLSTLPHPAAMAFVADGFSIGQGAASIGQTFSVDTDITLGRIILYAGDGIGTDARNTVRLALYALDPVAAGQVAASYTAGSNLLGEGEGEGVKISYAVQAPGLLQLDFSGANRLRLKAGQLYAFELQGEKLSPSIFWRRSRTDVYPGGAAYRDRVLTEEKDRGSADFAMAIYAAPAAQQ